MKTIWVGNVTSWNLKSSLRTIALHLLVDIVPVILLLVAMACCMAFVSHKMTEPRSVELQGSTEKQS